MDTNEMEMEMDMINRALKVIKQNEEWVTYVINFADPVGFIFADSEILEQIKDAIDEENPIHSGNSLGRCLRKCKSLLQV
jgi:hypothetical protein